MNSMPDEERLGRWLEDELSGAEREQVEAWVAEHPDWLAWRDETRTWKQTLGQVLPAEQAPPAAEFFEARIRRMVREERAPGGRRPLRQDGARRWGGGWWLPAAAAGMALCFWAGMRVAPATDRGSTPMVYTPEQGVEAEVFESDGADAMVIVLDGVQAIPDSFEIPDRAAREGETDDQSGALVRSDEDPGDPLQ
jgi:hypothetical protein